MANGWQLCLALYYGIILDPSEITFLTIKMRHARMTPLTGRDSGSAVSGLVPAGSGMIYQHGRIPIGKRVNQTIGKAGLKIVWKCTPMANGTMTSVTSSCRRCAKNRPRPSTVKLH